MSCQHCNQQRFDRPEWGQSRQRPAAGKKDHFPLSDESIRAKTPSDDLSLECHLLIDPCHEFPEDYFVYDLTGELLALKDNERGVMTIQVLHLSRSRLRKRRFRRLHEFLRALKGLSLIEEGLERDEVAFDLIQDFLANGAEYAGLLRYVVRCPSEFGIQTDWVEGLQEEGHGVWSPS